MWLGKNQAPDGVFRGEPAGNTFLVLVNALSDIARHPDIERPIALAGKDIDPMLRHAEDRSRLDARVKPGHEGNIVRLRE